MRRKKHKWINGTKGMISLLMAMLLLPFYSLAAVLVETLRYQSTVKSMDALLGTAGISTLANYDKHLQERFGLLAVSQKNGEDGLVDSLTSYLNKNKLTDAAGIQLDSVSADGMYPLADTGVLRRQIEEYSKILVPAKLAAEGLNIDNIVKELEKATKMGTLFSVISGGANVVGTEADALLAMDEAKETAKVVKRDVADYHAKYSEWCSAVKALTEHLATTCPSEDSDAKGYKTWNDTKDDLVKKADKAKGAYVSAISTLISSLNSLQSKADAVIRANEKFAAQAGDFVVQTGSGIYQESHAGDKSYENRDKASGAIAGAVTSGGNNYGSRMDRALRSFDSDRMIAASNQLSKEKEAVTAYKTEDVTATTPTPEAEKYHAAQVDDLADVDALEQLLSESREELQETGVIDTISSLISGLKSLLKLQTFFDPALNCKLDENFYESNYGGLPSNKNRASGAYALQEGNAEDEERSKAYLKEIDPDYDPDDPYGTGHSFDTSMIVKIMRDLKRLMNDAETLEEATGKEWLEALVDACDAVADMADHTMKFIQEVTVRVATMVTEGAYDRLLLDGYLAYNLPNRTNYTTGKTLTGYSFSKIAYGEVPHDVAYQLPTGASRITAMVNAVINGGGYAAKTFAGAELEYILWGCNSEIGNQFKQFFTLLVFRLLVDLQILANPEIAGIIAASNIASPLVSLLYVALEAFADTLVLVNGGDATFLKTTPYTTAGGIKKLVKELSKMPTSLKLVEQKPEESEESGETGEETASSEKEEPSGESEKKSIFSGIDFLAFNYTEHSLMLMLVFGSEQLYLDRLTDLIQSESSAYQELNISLSNRADGTPEEFDIDKSYTVIRAGASGSLKPLLPIPALSGKDPLTTKRVIYRGY